MYFALFTHVAKQELSYPLAGPQTPPKPQAHQNLRITLTNDLSCYTMLRSRCCKGLYT